MSPTCLNIAIVGAGIGAEHADGLAPLKRQFCLTHVCDLNEDRARALAAPQGAQAVTDIDTVLADPAVDVVDICLPPSMHVPMTLKALAAGKHVICEKPLAGSLADIDRIEAAARAAERKVLPVFQYRYGVAMRILNTLIKQNLLGPLHSATLETHWNRGADYYAVPWRGTMAYEMGGAVLSHAIHIHDLLTHISGPISEVSASLATLVNPIETEDSAALWMRTEQGALVTSSISLGAAEDHSRLRLVFQRATVESGTAPYRPALEPWTVTPRDPAFAKAILAATDSALLKPGPHHSGFSGYFAEAYKALTRRRSDIDLFDGRESIALASAIYQSAETRQAVCLPLASDNPYYQGWAREPAQAEAS